MKQCCCGTKETGSEKDQSKENTCEDMMEKCRTMFANCFSGKKKEDSGKTCC